MNRIATLAAVCSTAASVVLACSSSPGAPPFMPSSGDDASMGMGSDAGEEPAEEPAPMVPCADASLVLPTGSAKGGACGDCLKKNCADTLKVCEDDCTCVSGEMCLIVNGNNYTHCMAAMAAIGAGDPGLMAIATCLPHLCNAECNEAD